MIPLYKPFMPSLPDLDSVLFSGSLAYGCYTQQFEEKLKEYLGCSNVISVSSYGSAITIAIAALGLQWGDEIVASPVACLASMQPYVCGGLKVRWCDVDGERGTMDPDDLKRKITNRTKAIVHNHFCGYPGYIDEVNAIGESYGIPVLDDAIESFGSEYKGRKIGNCDSSVTVFAFSPVRIPNTIEGGAVVFRDRELYEKSLLIRDCGIDRRWFRDEIGEINATSDVSQTGYSAMMSNVNGYIGVRQMDYVHKLLSKQRINAVTLKDCLLDSLTDCQSVNSSDSLPNYWVYGTLVPDRVKAIHAFRDSGLYASGVHVRADVYSVFGKRVELRGVEAFNDHFVALPSGWWVGEEDYRHIFSSEL